MKANTLRNLPPELAKAVRKEAQRNGTSINKAVISLLQNKAEGRKRKKARKPKHQELDVLAGSWSKKEAAEFERALAAQRVKTKRGRKPFLRLWAVRDFLS